MFHGSFDFVSLWAMEIRNLTSELVFDGGWCGSSVVPTVK